MNTGLLRLAAALGFFAVIFGAFGAHGLQATLQAHDTAAIWQTGVDYHIYHALALLALAALPAAALHFRPTIFCWVLGLLVFSGSLYLLALTNQRWLGAITPLGGTLLLLGWLFLLLRAASPTKSAPPTKSQNPKSTAP